MNFLETARVARELTWVKAVGNGVTSADARRVQEWLTLNGYATAVDGECGPATMRQVAAFAAANNLPYDGVANLQILRALTVPMRWAFSFEVEAPTLRETVVAVARQHAMQRPREVGGDNRGPWVRAYCGRDGADYAWCAGSALSIVAQACAIRDQPMPVDFTLGCDELADSARKAHRLTHDPKLVRGGDLFLCYREGKGGRDYYHTGIVTVMHADSYASIEGNTNDDGSANGYEMIPRSRGLASKDYVLLGLV